MKTSDVLCSLSILLMAGMLLHAAIESDGAMFYFNGFIAAVLAICGLGIAYVAYVNWKYERRIRSLQSPPGPGA